MNIKVNKEKITNKLTFVSVFGRWTSGLRHHSWDIPVLAVPGSIPGVGPSWLVMAYKSNNNHKASQLSSWGQATSLGKVGVHLGNKPLKL